MAATGFTPISLYYTPTASNLPLAANLVAGELALNTADGKLFYKDSSNVVQVLATKGGVGSSTTTQVLYNSGGLVVGSANLVFNGTVLTSSFAGAHNGTVGATTPATGAFTTLTFPDASTQASAQVGMKNRVIDGGFILNQRIYVSGTSLASGTYGHDRWKGGASAGTYTFTQGSLGVNTTITITAGSIIQVIEGCNLAEGGTYVLSWTGTAQGRLNGGSYGASGTVTVTGWVAGTNLNVEFNTGTCGSVQLEKGSIATSFDYRDYGRELIMCQRYYATSTISNCLYGVYSAGYAGGSNHKLPVTMRAIPTVTYYSIVVTAINAPSVAVSYGYTDNISVVFNSSSAVGTLGEIQVSYTASAEL